MYESQCLLPEVLQLALESGDAEGIVEQVEGEDVEEGGEGVARPDESGYSAHGEHTEIEEEGEELEDTGFGETLPAGQLDDQTDKEVIAEYEHEIGGDQTDSGGETEGLWTVAYGLEDQTGEVERAEMSADIETLDIPRIFVPYPFHQVGDHDNEQGGACTECDECKPIDEPGDAVIGSFIWSLHLEGLRHCSQSRQEIQPAVRPIELGCRPQRQPKTSHDGEDDIDF